LIHRFFQTQFQNIPSWLDKVDFVAKYAKDVTAEDVVFVDIGAGMGQETQKLKDRTTSLVGRCILQDLAGPLERAPDILGVEKMEYDYFTPQKVKGRPFKLGFICLS
jgi:demethylsterigmatocystin 6-O-methyltransferase